MPTKEMCILLMVEAMYQQWLQHLAEKDWRVLSISYLVLRGKGMRRLFLQELKAVASDLLEEVENEDKHRNN